MNRGVPARGFLDAATLIVLCGLPAIGGCRTADHTRGSLSDTALTWPTVDEWRRVILLRDYNTRVVVISTAAREAFRPVRRSISAAIDTG